MKTHFGYQTVETQEKAPLVKSVFDSVAARYDVMNDVMSLGLHRLWKQEFVQYARPRNEQRILDMAGGTGDIAFRMLARAPLAEITVSDINQAMLEEGRKRAVNHNQLDLAWLCANAEMLPLPSYYFDAYTIAFGIRNVTDIPQALREARRVLKPGGHFVCLEFSQLSQAWMQKLYDAYSFNVIPRMGELVAKDAGSYQYLVESIRQFPDHARFAEMIREAGFGNVNVRRLTGGVVAIHSGWRV